MNKYGQSQKKNMAKMLSSLPQLIPHDLLLSKNLTISIILKTSPRIMYAFFKYSEKFFHVNR